MTHVEKELEKTLQRIATLHERRKVLEGYALYLKELIGGSITVGLEIVKIEDREGEPVMETPAQKRARLKRAEKE